MTVVLVTGMSGTGKSAASVELARRGHRVVDTDYGDYSEEVPSPDAGGSEQRWREDRIEALLDDPGDGVLFISGCVSNQRIFYPRFDAVVLLTALSRGILDRVANRESNPFGRRHAERDRIVSDLATVEPLLHATATTVIDTRAPLITSWTRSKRSRRRRASPARAQARPRALQRSARARRAHSSRP